MSHPSKSRAPILCYVTDRKGFASEGNNQNEALLKHIGIAAAAGIDWIQIREKDLSGRELSSLTRGAVARTKQISERNRQASRILVNERLDVAYSERAGGVHLGEHSLPVQDVRNWLDAKSNLAERDKFMVGVSCHSVQAAASAARDGAGYVFFGPVFATPSKTSFGAPQGLGKLAEVCSSVTIPVLAIGGITPDNAWDCLAVGAAGIAAIRLFQNAENFAYLVTDLRGSFR
ncbi:MAG: thiamine-phosphate pyrophosphorylase [Acidobacteriaceae bacterium]|nr:thiamine-phosphate pyrophosphorylase [Acidobacteriaceae bacterium]